MSEVKMKTVIVSWREIHFFETKLEVPVDFDDEEIAEALWSSDLSLEEPVDIDGSQIDSIDEVK